MLRQAGSARAQEDDVSTRLLSAALAQFEDFGLRRTTIEDIARRAGVSRVTVYRRFGNKETLARAVVLRELQRFLFELDQAVGTIDDPVERLAEGFAFSLRYVRNHTLVDRLLRTEPDALLPYLTLDAGPVLGVARQFIAERMSEEIDKGRIPPIEVELAGEMLARLVLSFLLTPQTSASIETAEEARDFARRYLAPALLASAAKPSSRKRATR
ncbi:MAG: TetR/AcrR family transcriptional regulator [Actinomycetota bacterium]